MNDQIAQALAQLRDIHEPAAPAFWPIPIGWWILAMTIIVAISCTVWWLRTRHVNDRPYRSIRVTAAELRNLYGNGQLSEQEYVDGANRLYKHLLVSVETVPGSVQADGSLWLNMLAERFDEEAFVTGPGKCLGTVRYQPVDFFDNRLDGLIERTLCIVRYPSRRAVVA